MLHRVEAATIGQFASVNTGKQSWRRERGSGGEDSLGNRGGSLKNRGDSRENRRVPRRIHPVFFPWFTCDAVLWRPLQSAYSSLQSTYSSPDWGMAVGDRSRRRSGRKAFGAMRPPGVMSTRGLAAAAGARAALPTTSTRSLPVPRLKPERAVSCFLGRGTRPPGNSTDTEWRLSVGFRYALAGTLPGPSCGFLAGVKEAGGNKAMLGGVTRATTLTRPLLSAVVQMCRTFQKSSVNRVGRPCRDSMSGTLSSESRCRMSSRTTRASPKRRDAWLMEATAVTGTSAFRRSDMMARSIAGAARAGRPGGASRGRASRLFQKDGIAGAFGAKRQ